MPIVNARTLEDGDFRGAAHGASISIIFDHSEPKHGPRLHRHPYDETWIVEEGRLSFQLGDHLHDVGPGEIVIAPPNVPHKFTNGGPERAKLICIHASPKMTTEWLE